MTNYKYYNYNDLNITSSKKPLNSHLFIELSNGHLLLVDSTSQTDLLISNDKGEAWNEVDTGAFNNGKITRTQKIQSIWYDRTNSKIWFVDCDNDGVSTDFNVWYLDTSTYNKTEVGTSTATADWTKALDIFQIGSDMFVFAHEHRAGFSYVVVVWEVDTAPFTEEDTQGEGDFYGVLGYGVVANNIYYALASFNADLAAYKYTDATTTIASTATLLNYDINSAKNLLGLAYDGNNLLYGVANYDTGDTLNYLCYYSISGDSWSVGGRYDVSLMLDRNTDSTADPPNNLEKGFHISEDEVYQIPSVYKGRLNLVSNFNFSDDIIGITDHFLMDNSGNMYEYEDLTDHIIRMDITHDKEDYPRAKGIVRRDKITLTKNLFMQITGKYSADQTTINSHVVFEGKVQNKDGKKLQTFDCVGLGVEMTTVQPSGTISETTNDIIKAINAGSNSITNIPTYIIDGTLSVGQSIVNNVMEGDKSYKSIVNHFKDIDKFTWGLRPQGAIDYNDGTVDSGVDLRYNGNSFVNKIWNVNTFDLPTGVNRVEVKGAINTSTGVPYSGSWDDEELQQSENIKLFTISDATLNSNSLCNVVAQSIGERESTSTTTVQFNARDTTIGMPQTSQTIDFEYLSKDVNIALDTLIVDRVVLDIKTDILFIEASTGLVFEYKRKSPLENLPEENSQLLLQNARSIQGLQSDINALISDTVYSQTDWNAVTTIGASKNALSDKFELMQSEIDTLLTQTDLNGYATQTDLNGYVTQTEGNTHLTQTDINNMATQTDLNAKISDTVYSQTDWNAVTTIGASKNAIYDKLELMQSEINNLFLAPIGTIMMYSGSWTDNNTIPGWYKCDGNNSTVNMVNKFVRGAATSGATGGSDDAVIVSHSHQFKGDLTTGASIQGRWGGNSSPSWQSGAIETVGVSGTGANIPAYYALIFIQRIS